MAYNHVFDAAVANVEDDIVYTAGGTTFRFGGDYVTPGTFEFFGVPPFMGRALEPSDFQPGAPPVFVLRYATWVSQFQADPALIGKTFNLNGISRTLVGVMAPRFAWGGVELWLPRSPDAVEVRLDGHFRRYWGMVAHLRPGVSLREAQADLTVIAQRLAILYPEEYPKRFSIEVDSFAHAVVPEQFRKILYVLFAAVVLLLLIGCANVANLLLARATTREREFALRSALGAARSDVLKMVLGKGLQLLLLGIAIGLAASFAVSRLLVSQLWGVSPHDPLTLAAVASLLLLVGLMACWIPARRATRVNPSTALRYE